MQIIGINGMAGVGKDTVADYLCSEFGFVKYGFADPLKAMLKAIGVDPKTRGEKEGVNPVFGVTNRSMMETLGTEWMRDCVAQDGWLRLASRRLAELKALNSFDAVPQVRGMVICDVRYENEADWIRENGGQVWQVLRPSVTQTSAHKSNAILRVPHVDKVLVNMGTIEELLHRVRVLAL